MLLVTTTITARSETSEQVAGVLHTLSQASQGDRGCISHGFGVDIGDPNLFRSIELWESLEAHDGHMRTSHVKAALARVDDLIAGEVRIDVFHVGNH